MYEIEILLIDDNLVDIEWTREAFNQNKLKNNLNIVSNGAEAMAFLRGEIRVPQPDLILLDSTFAQYTDQGIFAAIKEDEQLRDIPLFMLTSDGSKPLNDHQIPPNGFVSKPFDFIQFINVIKSIKAFRVAIVTTN